MFHIVLVEPQIPPNTGNIMRLCANTACHLHLIEPLGFSLSEKQLRRAGMDYIDLTTVSTWSDWDTFLAGSMIKRWISFSTHHTRLYTDFTYIAGDALVFGSEGKGLANEIRQNPNQAGQLTLPMLENSRSINLANTVSIVVYEAWRQCGFSA